MDLGAYVNIDDLGAVMKANNIEVPRLRGLRLMSKETPLTKEEISEMAYEQGIYECECVCESRFKWNPSLYELSYETDRIKEKYLVMDGKTPIGIRWDKVHGKKRKLFKYSMRKAKQRVEEQYAMFNKYAGRDDVLYIHARIGAGNWGWYNCDEIVKEQPWYLDHCEDAFDCTYVDIYAKIKEVE